MRIIARLCIFASFLVACSSSDYVVVKLTADPSLPPVAQLQISADDGRSQASALVPTTPDPTGIVFPETCVIGVPAAGTLQVAVQGMDANGNVVARGAATASVSSGVQAADVALDAACQSSLDCDPAGVCSGAVICGDAGSCVAGTNTLAPDATACGEDGGHCYSGNCLASLCGDGIVEVGEECDLGPLNGATTSTCTATCTIARCGDGFVNADPLPDGGVFLEICDWGDDGGVDHDGGNSNTLPNHCRENCLPPRCGDGVVDTGERCDLGPLSPAGDAGNGAGVGCNTTCNLLEQLTILAGDGNQAFRNGAGTQAEFYLPEGLAVTGGLAYVADSFNDLVRQIDLDSGVVTTLAGQPGDEQDINGPRPNAIGSPLWIALFDAGLVVTQLRDVRLLALDGTLSTLVGQFSAQASEEDGFFGDAGFVSLEAVAFDGQNLFVTDQGVGVRELDLAAQTVTTFSGGIDGGAAIDSTYCTGILALDRLLYIAEADGEVLSFDPATGAAAFVAGTSGASGFVDGLGIAARFTQPFGLCTDGISIYVADQDNGAVRQIDPATGLVTTVVGNGTYDNLPVTVGVGRQAQLGEPIGCGFDPVSGDLIVTDLAANQIFRIH